jgi:hypothetical protein
MLSFSLTCDRTFSIVLLVSVLSLAGCERNGTKESARSATAGSPSADRTSSTAVASSPEKSPTDQKRKVNIQIDFDDGAILTVDLDVGGEPILVEDLMKQLQEHPHAPKIELTGTGVTCFVRSIGGLDTTNGKGWTYKVNETRADVGIGQLTVSPGDWIQWNYAEW